VSRDNKDRVSRGKLGKTGRAERAGKSRESRGAGAGNTSRVSRETRARRGKEVRGATGGCRSRESKGVFRVSNLGECLPRILLRTCNKPALPLPHVCREICRVFAAFFLRLFCDFAVTLSRRSRDFCREFSAKEQGFLPRVCRSACRSVYRDIWLRVQSNLQWMPIHTTKVQSHHLPMSNCAGHILGNGELRLFDVGVTDAGKDLSELVV
jgi:hypothetical protein